MPSKLSLKVIHFVVFFLFLLFSSGLFTPPVLADCSIPGVIRFPTCRLTGHPVSCWIGPPQELVLCCDDISECPTNNQITPVPRNANPTDIYCADGQVNTALGCLDAGSASNFVSQILGWVTGLVSVASLLFLSYGGIMIMTSSGDPKRVKAGQEIIISAISAIILVVLSVVLLNFVGVNILNLGGLGFSL